MLCKLLHFLGKYSGCHCFICFCLINYLSNFVPCWEVVSYSCFPASWEMLHWFWNRRHYKFKLWYYRFYLTVAVGISYMKNYQLWKPAIRKIISCGSHLYEKITSWRNQLCEKSFAVGTRYTCMKKLPGLPLLPWKYIIWSVDFGYLLPRFTCHTPWTEISEIRPVSRGDLSKFCMSVF